MKKRNKETERDPVCGMDLTPDDSTEKTTYNQQTYYFCSTGCKDKFDSDPAEFEVESARNVEPARHQMGRSAMR